MVLFYTPDINGDQSVLDPDESRHILKVLRLKPGDEIYSTDGIGNLFKSEILPGEGKRCSVRIVETYGVVDPERRSTVMDLSPRNYHLHLAVAPTKNIERFEWFLEKATEIGIDEITPLLCEHSERKALKPDRLEKVLVAAMKQSLKVWKPVLNPMAKFGEFLAGRQLATDGQQFIAHLDEHSNSLKKLYKPGTDVTILIGPEGDFSEKELQLAAGAEFRTCTLGSSRLRTETAAIVACEAIALINE